jgi:rare lipoprotein A
MEREVSERFPPGLDLHTLAPYLEGVASWYGPTFHGKPTANGEVYNQYGLTAAHPVLPIGTKIEVENLENRRKVWVRINDRGPYAKGRVLDLSKIAAQQLGMIQNGTARVRITVLQWPETVNPNLGLKAYTQYVVQAAAYPDLEEAEHLRERLQARFPQAPVMIDIASNGFFAVVAGPFDDESEARQFSRAMQRQGITNLVRRYRN